MALLESLKIPLMTKIPDFTLKDPFGKTYLGNKQFGEKGLLVVITCNHCPYALAVWPRLIRLADQVGGEGVNTIAINPNIHPGYPDDSPDQMIKKIKEWKINFPYLVDETQEVARLFLAQCTPDVYLFNKNKELVYHGRIDDNWQDEKKVKRKELKEAINLMVKGQPIDSNQRPSMGCSIKWRN